MSIQADTGLTTKVSPSPNHGERVDEASINMLVLHYTGMTDGPTALRRLCDPRAEVSAHYMVEVDGSITQCVPEARRAWHAGKSCWKGERDLNSCSIGLEIVNPGHDGGYPDFPRQQIEVVTDLARDICDRHDILPWRILAHSDIAPERKMDPGEKFPWSSLARNGVGHYVPPAPITPGLFMQVGESGQPVEAVQSLFAVYGYDIDINGCFDEVTRNVVQAFQRHFRPDQVDGVVDLSTLRTLQALLTGLPALDP